MAQPDGLRHALTAAELLTPVWRNQVDDLRHWEAELRQRQPEAVHHFRVVTRRLRSNLAGFGPLLGDMPSRALAKDLRRTAAAIGDGRDAQVVRAGLPALFTDETGAASARLQGRLAERLDLIRAGSWQRSSITSTTPTTTPSRADSNVSQTCPRGCPRQICQPTRRSYRSCDAVVAFPQKRPTSPR